MTQIQAIETSYHGCLFRSRLEARWAVFFDALKLNWQYEPEGFKLSTGEWYLPDFLLYFKNGPPLWIEIKPTSHPVDSFRTFIKDKMEHGAILREIADSRKINDEILGGISGDDYEYFHPANGWDKNYQFCMHIQCTAIGFEKLGSSFKMPCECNKLTDRHPDRTYHHPRILEAYEAAKAARFGR